MNRPVLLIAPAALSLALIATPAGISAYAAGGGGGGGGGGDISDFISGYRSAYATIYEQHDYARAIEQLRALGHDDYANVANLIGYSWRKLGDYKLSQVWYERALKSDPNHVLTWNYYGLWQIEQGNREQAEYHLTRIAAICGTDCAEYRSLAEALEKPPGTSVVY